MEQRNVVSVSWGDHLTFGEGDGRLASPDAVKRRMKRWQDELNADTVHWRLTRTHIQGHYYAARGRRHPLRDQDRNLGLNFFQVVPHLAHSFGMKTYLYVSLFDEGWPLLPKRIREVSYHNAMHFQHTSWQSRFSRENPEYTLTDRSGQQWQWGVLCLAYPEVRSHFCSRFLDLLQGTEFDGLFVCLRSQSRPADFADQFGFNEPVRQDFLGRYGRDICKEDYDLQEWRNLLGEYLTTFLSELRQACRDMGLRLAVGAARGEVLGPPLGNTTLAWSHWVQRGIIDELVINQNSSQCPSMWHQLWPMHRGYGYLQNYLDGYNMPPLLGHLESDYEPVFRDLPADLYVARQWDERSAVEERDILDQPAVKGLVLSSFRFDNPGPVSRGDWRA
ncbi:MAG: hypothetical protein PVH08_13495 [Syntrophobacterales bacterium]